MTARTDIPDAVLTGFIMRMLLSSSCFSGGSSFRIDELGGILFNLRFAHILRFILKKSCLLDNSLLARVSAISWQAKFTVSS